MKIKSWCINWMKRGTTTSDFGKRLTWRSRLWEEEKNKPRWLLMLLLDTLQERKRTQLRQLLSLKAKKPNNWSISAHLQLSLNLCSSYKNLWTTLSKAKSSITWLKFNKKRLNLYQEKQLMCLTMIWKTRKFNRLLKFLISRTNSQKLSLLIQRRRRLPSFWNKILNL